ncbi:MAG: hypothetical protein RMK74_12070 [Myxococcales bacterium]|nr:hypothetical protein [Myxococcales bacterium]
MGKLAYRHTRLRLEPGQHRIEVEAPHENPVWLSHYASVCRAWSPGSDTCVRFAPPVIHE